MFALLFMSPCLAGDNLIPQVAMLYVAGAAAVAGAQPQPAVIVGQRIPNNIRPKRYDRRSRLENNYKQGKKNRIYNLQQHSRQ